jgi:predicted nucleotidyltransferase
MTSFPELAAVLENEDAVAAAWVFGSVARGQARVDSDVDVAVLLRDRDADPAVKRKELARLAARLEVAAGRRVDLAVLSLRDPILAHRVLCEGILVADADLERRIDFANDAIARYLDWAPRYEAAAARSLEANRAWARGARR